MYELLRRGFVAALVPKGVPNVDILLSNPDGSRLASLQVKTMGAPRKKWQLKSKHETIESDRLFYCFVRPTDENLGEPQCWIIPSAVVAKHVRLSHAEWLKGLPQRGDTRNDGPGRSMHFSCEPIDLYPEGWMEKYMDNWDSLHQAKTPNVA